MGTHLSSFLVVFDKWMVIFSVIEEANWLTLPEDIPKPGDGFDAVICLGNSFAHLPDFKGNLVKLTGFVGTWLFS